MEGRIRLTNNRLQVDPPVSNPPFQADISFLTHSGTLTKTLSVSGSFGNESEVKAHSESIADRRTEAPKASRTTSASGVPMIWGDVGLSELVPLPMMGEGMTRIARLILAISDCIEWCGSR